MLSAWINKGRNFLISAQTGSHNKIRLNTLALVLLFCFIFLVIHVAGLSNDIINPDAVNWHYRTQQFMNGIKYQQWEKTYQHYHPGVTVMWVTGVPLTVAMKLMGTKEYSMYTFEAFDFVSKYSLVIAQLILTVYIIFILKKYFGFMGALLFGAVLSFEPFFLGNSRLYHLDALHTLLLFAALITGYIAYERRSLYYYVGAGFLMALAFLTKSITILGFGFYGLWYLIRIIQTKRLKADIKYLFVFGVAFVLATFIFFPALWVKPVYYLGEIFSESERVGLRRGHDQIVLGEEQQSASPIFYLLVVLLRSSPFLIFGVTAFILYSYKLAPKIKAQMNKGFISYISLFSLVYLVFISVVSKKIDRYELVLVPFLAVFCVYGLLALAKVQKSKILILVLYIAFVVYPLIKYYPYYFTYTNPFFGSPEDANKIIGFKPFGVGIYELKNSLISRYGAYPRLGFIDTKPIEAIYPTSKVVDIRVNGTSDYDIMVLGINEQIPEKVQNSESKFKHTYSQYINGLEYWRIYEKQE